MSILKVVFRDDIYPDWWDESDEDLTLDDIRELLEYYTSIFENNEKVSEGIVNVFGKSIDVSKAEMLDDLKEIINILERRNKCVNSDRTSR